MKKIFTLSLAFAILAPALATSILNPKPLNANQIMIPIAKGQFISVYDLAYMKASDFEKVSGKKMTLMKKVQLKLAQNKLRKSINYDGTVNNRKLERMFKDEMSGTTGFHLGGFALGVFLFLIGVLIAYLINDEKKANRVKWAWIGAIVSLLLGVAIFA